MPRPALGHLSGPCVRVVTLAPSSMVLSQGLHKAVWPCRRSVLGFRRFLLSHHADTMSGRIAKRFSRSHERRVALAAAIESQGGLAEMPCTFCFRQNRPCRMAEGSSRCAECTRRGRVCDGKFVGASLLKMLEETKKLEREETEAEEALFILQTQLSTAVGRLARIRRMKRSLKDRSAEAFSRGVQEVEEEDGVLNSEEGNVVGFLEGLGVPENVDWSALGLGDGFHDLGSLHEPPGTVEAPPDIPSGGA